MDAVVAPRKTTYESIASPESLAAALSIGLPTLQQAIALPAEEKYTVDTRPKADGGERVIHKPHHLVRLAQRRINNRIFKSIICWPSYLYGSIPNHRNELGHEISKDYIACAKQHCGAKSLLKMDVKDFFSNIHRDIVAEVFQEFLSFPQEVSELLTELCTFNEHLVQGALSSPYLANLALYDVEADIVRRLAQKGLTYTRYVDDITVSSRISRYDFSFAIKIIEGMLTNKGLPINSAKTKIIYSSTQPLTVHGLRICFKEPRLPADEAKKIRSAVQNLEKIAAEKNYRCTHAYRHDFNRCMGRVNKLGRVKHSQHRKLVKRMLAIYPLPSKKDIDRVKLIVFRLERDNPTKKDTYWYSRRFYLAHERLNILKRSYPKVSKELRHKLKQLKPTYD